MLGLKPALVCVVHDPWRVANASEREPNIGPDETLDCEERHLGIVGDLAVTGLAEVRDPVWPVGLDDLRELEELHRPAERVATRPCKHATLHSIQQVQRRWVIQW